MPEAVEVTGCEVSGCSGPAEFVTEDGYVCSSHAAPWEVDDA